MLTPTKSSSASSGDGARLILGPRLVLRWVYIGRICMAAAVFLAATFVWRRVETIDTLIISLTFISALIVTSVSVYYSEIQQRPLADWFIYLQSVYDLLLVTAVVHVTGAGASQFAALYILVIASAALLLPIGGGLLVAALGNVLYFADSIWGGEEPLTLSVWLQLLVFGIVALSTGYISERLRAARMWKEQLTAELYKVRLQAADILRNIRSGILTVDTGGRLLYANPAASSLLGLELDNYVGRPVMERLTAVAPQLAAALARTVHSGIRTLRGESQVHTEQRQFPIGVTTTHIPDASDSSRTRATAIFQDISDHKRLEELHLRAERLEAVAELSAALAHEIKNPLASIRSSVEQLARQKTSSDDERTLGDLIVRESDRLSRLLTEFIDFARVQVTRVARVDLGQTVRGAAELALVHPDRRQGVKVECVAPGQPVMVDGDEDLLHRAVFNLVLNAIQAAPDNGSVRIELEPCGAGDLPVGVPFDGDGVVLRVSDDGPGIPIEIRERVFDPFFTTKPEGSGLGLPVVHRAIEAHRGLVYIDSNGAGTRGGTTFTVLLPLTHTESGAVAW